MLSGFSTFNFNLYNRGPIQFYMKQLRWQFSVTFVVWCVCRQNAIKILVSHTNWVRLGRQKTITRKTKLMLYLNAMVAVVWYEDVVVCSNRQVAWWLELSVSAATPTNPSHQAEVDVEHVKTVVSGVRHDHVTRLRCGDAVRPRRKFSFRRRFDVTLADQTAC